MQINFLKPKKNFKKKNLELGPNFYWKIIILVTFLLTLSSFIFGYFTFEQVKEDESLYFDGVQKKQSIEKQRVAKALEYFSLKEQKSLKILNSPSPVVDPSI
jgi:uncharacterized protein YabE (DUF348 family)